MPLYLELIAFTYQLYSQKSIHWRVGPLHSSGRPTRWWLLSFHMCTIFVKLCYVKQICNFCTVVSIIKCNSLTNRISKLWLRTSSLSYQMSLQLCCVYTFFVLYLSKSHLHVFMTFYCIENELAQSNTATLLQCYVVIY